jgi:hypothetical protein
MAERCPTCGLRFEREAGFFLGAYVINYGVTAGALILLLAVFIGLQAADAHISTAPVAAAGVAIAVLVPVVSYPFSRTVWSAVDLAMRRPEPNERDEAAGWIEGRNLPAGGEGLTGRRTHPSGAERAEPSDD